MLIKIFDVVLNVSAVKKIVIVESVRKTNVGFFKKPKEETVYDCVFQYKDEEGKDAKFTWTGAPDEATAGRYQNEILKQIKEVELEKMSALLEDAIRKS